MSSLKSWQTPRKLEFLRKPRTVRAGATEHWDLKARHGRGGVKGRCAAVLGRDHSQQLVQAYVIVQLHLHQRLYAALALSKCYTFSMKERWGGTCGCKNPVKSSSFSFGVRMNCTDKTVSIAELKADRMAGISWL
jgi:hypothetical protein